jgi:hypothetical protein
MIPKIATALLAFTLAAPGLAQTTCSTNTQGTTLCSTPEGVVQGGTDSTGASVYRDDRGHRLDFRTDWSGKASVELPSGQSVDWSQGVLGEKKYPFSKPAAPSPLPHAASPRVGPGGLPATLYRQYGEGHP